jgi:hypothetical protein
MRAKAIPGVRKTAKAWRERKLELQQHPELRKYKVRKHSKKCPTDEFSQDYRRPKPPVTLVKLECLARIDKVLKK